MLNEEQKKEEITSLLKAFEDAGLTEGMLYVADMDYYPNGKTSTDGKEVLNAHVKNAAFGISKYDGAMYPHVEAKLIGSKNGNNGMDEKGTICFIDPSKYGDPVEDYDFEKLHERAMYDISNLKTFAADIKATSLDSNFYLNQLDGMKKEKENLVQNIEQLSKFLTDKGILKEEKK